MYTVHQVDYTSLGTILRLPPFARTDDFIEAGNVLIILYTKILYSSSSYSK